MEHIFIPATSALPTIDFHFELGKLRISGRSLASDPPSFYEPLLESLEAYVAGKHPHTLLTIDLELFNTQTTKYLLDILKKLKTLVDNGNALTVNWYYDNAGIKEIALSLSEVSMVPVTLINKH